VWSVRLRSRRIPRRALDSTLRGPGEEGVDGGRTKGPAEEEPLEGKSGEGRGLSRGRLGRKPEVDGDR